MNKNEEHRTGDAPFMDSLHKIRLFQQTSSQLKQIHKITGHPKIDASLVLQPYRPSYKCGCSRHFCDDCVQGVKLGLWVAQRSHSLAFRKVKKVLLTMLLVFMNVLISRLQAFIDFKRMFRRALYYMKKKLKSDHNNFFKNNVNCRNVLFMFTKYVTQSV